MGEGGERERESEREREREREREIGSGAIGDVSPSSATQPVTNT